MLRRPHLQISSPSTIILIEFSTMSNAKGVSHHHESSLSRIFLKSCSPQPHSPILYAGERSASLHTFIPAYFGILHNPTQNYSNHHGSTLSSIHEVLLTQPHYARRAFFANSWLHSPFTMRVHAAACEARTPNLARALHTLSFQPLRT